MTTTDYALLEKVPMANPSHEVNALLGRGSEFEGKLTFEGTVRIDGKFTGEIFSNDTLIIGEGARVKAEIDVANVIIYGDLIGNVRSKTSVELHAPARLKGNITAPALVVDQGVVFDGSCNMTTSDRARKELEAMGGGGLPAAPAPAAGMVPPMAPKPRPEPSIM
ncbi:MAG: polymer-forming cytoskeletal protein [Myxococcales bacterium]|nr:polymer-forming cytoskeletal protein [Myxococcales bacterium]